MMKMKTITTVAVAGMMVFSLTACGSGAGTEKTGDASGNQTAESGAAAETIDLSVAYADAENSVFAKGADAFAEKLSELSGGTMTCTMYPNGTLGSISEVAAMIQQGTCDVSPIVTSSLVDFCPELGVFDLPFLFTDYDDARTTIEGKIGTYFSEQLASAGMHVGHQASRFPLWPILRDLRSGFSPMKFTRQFSMHLAQLRQLSISQSFIRLWNRVR